MIGWDFPTGVAEVPAQDGFDDRIWSRLDLVGGRDPGIRAR
jgi:hypothetical protein